MRRFHVPLPDHLRPTVWAFHRHLANQEAAFQQRVLIGTVAQREKFGHPHVQPVPVFFHGIFPESFRIASIGCTCACACTRGSTRACTRGTTAFRWDDRNMEHAIGSAGRIGIRSSCIVSSNCNVCIGKHSGHHCR